MGVHIKDWLSFKLKILTWILELRARVKALEPLEARVEALEAKVAAPAVSADATPAPTDDKLLELCWEQDTLVSLRLAYELGRQHGAAANSKPAPNFEALKAPQNPRRSPTAPAPLAGGLVERVENRAGGDGRAALREVANWLRVGRLLHAAELLEQEADRG